ncbi:uroporphyrinogen decarboxylase [Candidatus Raskinella chloraquaticus]|uniref:Uroporphyrinogen decarboxylase n=1 Tax=Candidatus Raskinella chloraquaticus TaxID=1951219 RepID=A0A1W9HYJ0_9HYPH|nr:MAG: uroporphyrinogen decarboxylase [Proteobacteria bacterium SG_bin8]
MNATKAGRFQQTLSGHALWPPPLWLMRQAGRYLPEYRAVRAQAGSFLDLCFSPELACEVTLQPIRRFDFDAAILFSDILVIPHAMGRDVRFMAGEGPRLDPLQGDDDIDRLVVESAIDRLDAVYEAVAAIRSRLGAEKALIGFCGGPWTVATYMIAGRGKDEQIAAKHWAYASPQRLDRLIDRLCVVSIQHLIAQLKAGADTVQIFETWSGALDASAFERFVVRPTARIVKGVRETVPDAKIIGFPRGAGPMLPFYAEVTGVDAIGFDWGLDPQWVSSTIGLPVQGNLDPLRLVAGRAAIDEGLERLLPAMRGRPFVFNLGHGITPEARIEDVAYLVDCVRTS